MISTRFISGTYNAICDICGVQYKASKLVKNWKGLYVCPKDYEERQPLDFIRGRTDNQSVPWTRPAAEDTFVRFCYLQDTEAYAGQGTAGCMRAGFTSNLY
jgi:hypothetical protein